MDRLTTMKVFATVARLGSFVAAADELGISNAMCSKYVRNLENSLGARLINRTTRQLSLTEVGGAYHNKIIGILADVEEAEQSVSELQNNPVGTLRIMSSSSFGAFHIARAIRGYKKQCPRVTLELILSDDFENLVDKGMDLAFQVGWLPDSSNIALKLSSSRLIVCAAPAYIEEHGAPETPAGLKDHVCLSMRSSLFSPSHWTFNIDGEEATVDVNSDYLITNKADVLRVAAINGSGLTQLPSYVIGLDIQSGRLRPLLEDYEPRPLPISMVYSHRQHMSLKIRSFVDYMKGYFKAPPYWDKWMFEKK